MEIVEYRGVTDLVAAKILTDDADSYTTDTPFEVAGVAEISRTTDSSSEAHYYNNIPAVIVQGTSADTVTISASAIPLDVYAKITSQYYDSNTGALIEGERKQEYFAIGYKTKKTNGDEVYVWRYKGSFNVPGVTNTTENDGTDANGQEIVYTGIQTSHKFTKNNAGAKAMCVDVGKELADVSAFFSTVTTPDTLTPKTARTLTITQAANTTVTVLKNGNALTTGATVYDGDELKISVTGGTLTVNSVAFTSGDIHVVTGNTTVVSAASA